MKQDWPRLAEAVAKRRRELGLSQDAIRQADGPSDVVLGNIENNKGRRPRANTINKLDKPLRWEPGSAQQILAGGNPDCIERTLDLRKIPNDELLDEIKRRFEEGPSVAGRTGAADEREHPFPGAFFERPGDSGPGEATGEDRRENSR